MNITTEKCHAFWMCERENLFGRLVFFLFVFARKTEEKKKKASETTFSVDKCKLCSFWLKPKKLYAQHNNNILHGISIKVEILWKIIVCINIKTCNLL